MQSKQAEKRGKEKLHSPVWGGEGLEKESEIKREQANTRAGNRGPATFCQGLLRCFTTARFFQTPHFVWPLGSPGSCKGRRGGGPPKTPAAAVSVSMTSGGGATGAQLVAAAAPSARGCALAWPPPLLPGDSPSR